MLNKKKDQISFRLKKLENQEPINLRVTQDLPSQVVHTVWLHLYKTLDYAN